MQKQSILSSLLTVGNLFVSPMYAGAVKEKSMNIIYIMSDDHTQQMISCYNNRFASTPNIDRLAAEGVRFSNSFVANSISGPSRACLLTGKHSHKNGFSINSDSFDGNQQTFPKLLQASGYQTAIIGKWHLGSKPVGFDHWEILPGQGDYYNPDFVTDSGKKRESGYVTDLITDKSIAWLEQRDKTKPFCLLVHHKATHRNWMPKIADLYAYENKTFPLPANLFDSYENREAAATAEMQIDKHMTFLYDLKVTAPHGYKSNLDDWFNSPDRNSISGRMSSADREIFTQFYDSIQQDFQKRNLTGKDLVVWKYQRYLKDYLKTAKSLDDNIGRLIEYLKKEGLLNNTLIVYTSDQGFYMGEHGWFDKRFMYEESLRTPLIMRLPDKCKHRGVIPQMVQNIDHAATFLDIANVKVPSDIQGTSYLPLLKGDKPGNWRKSIYYHYQEFPGEHAVKRHYGIRTTRYKLIHFYNDIDAWELYDLKKDPTEMNNLIHDKRYSDRIQKLKTELWNLQIKYDDPIRFKYPLK